MTKETITPVRAKRVSFTNVAPSASNGWSGSVTATIAETGEQFVVGFATPELVEVQARAVVAGYAARLSIAVSGKKEVADIAAALTSEIEQLNKGIYTVRGGHTSTQSSFNDTVISMALLEAFPDIDPAQCNFAKEDYDAVVANHTFLAGVQAKWDAADDAGKRELVTPAVAKTKRLVGFYKV